MAKTDTGWSSAAALFRELLGYGPGERISTPEQLTGAVESIAQRYPDTCSLEEYGKTFEGRPLQLLTIASPANHKRLAAIKAANRAIGRGEAVSMKYLAATVWVIANVHGDEHSTAEAAVMLACGLCDGKSPLLDGAVVCIDPCQNPDGRARSVNSYYSLFGLKPRIDSNAAEHHDPWGGGRGNHYFFDMNRDWFPMTQPESRARVESFLAWRPQIVADLHEMWWDSRYFFPPPAVPMNPNLGEHTLRWWRDLGREIAGAFDENNWDYWTSEIFDAFFPGYGEAFPSIHGAIGMTFEQASAAGLGVQRQDGTLLTYEEAIHHHFTASLTVCRVASQRRETLLADTRTFFASAVKDLHGAFVFPEAGPGTPADRLAQLLMNQGIAVDTLDGDVQTSVLMYEYGDEREETLPAGSVVVRLNQPEGRAVKAILERETAIDSDFLAEQIRRVSERMPAEMYDHTAWSLPLAMGLECFRVDNETLPLRPWKPMKASAPGSARYGYLVPLVGIEGLSAVCRLMDKDIRVHVTRQPFRLGDTTYPRGTAIVKKADQTVEWKRVTALVGPTAVSVDTAWTDSGISLGSDHVALVRKPRIAVLYGEPCSSLSYGWIAYLFEQRLDLVFTPIRVPTLKEADLRRYDVIVLPNGKPETYSGHLSEDTWKALNNWVRQGGTLITLGGAAECIVGKGKDWTTCRLVKDLREPGQPEESKKDEPVPPEYRPERVCGAALRVVLDRHHQSTLGFGEESHVIYTTDALLTPSVEGRNAAVFDNVERLVIAGFVWEKMIPALAGKAYLVDETLGRGHLLLFADDPNQRGYWDVTSRLFVNAVLFGSR